jgi:hypothetical protein
MIHAALGLLLICVLLRSACSLLRSSKRDYHRGQRVLNFPQARRAIRKRRTGESTTFFFGDLAVPVSELLYGLFALGLPGAGKSVSLRLILQTLLPAIAPGTNTRALVFDPKQDLLPIIAGLPLDCQLDTLHPFDRRGLAWDVAADTTSPAHAIELSYILAPEGAHESQPFFADAGRHLVSSVIQSFTLSAVAWDLRDLILATRSAEDMTEILCRHTVTAPIAAQYLLHDPRLASNILATLATKLARIEPIAAGWSVAQRRISLREWLAEESILVLGSDPAARTPLAAINAVIINRLTELVLSEPDSTSRRTYLVLDELAELGKLALLVTLLTVGRAKGAAVLATTQSLALIKSLYGEHDAHAILSQFQNRMLFRVGAPEDARWASELAGDVQHWQANRPNKGPSAKTLVTEPAFLPSEFLSLPPTTPDNGMTAVWMPRILSGVYKHAVCWDDLMASLLPAADGVVAAERRADVEFFLRPWDDADRRRLGLGVVVPTGVGLPGRIEDGP